MNKSRTINLSGVDQDLVTQISLLKRQILMNPVTVTILERANGLSMPGWYLGAGCISQTVWNIAHGFDPAAHIKDYDLVYYDDSDTSYAAEDYYVGQAKKMFADLDAHIDVINEARVHLWYAQRFGREIAPYRSTEDAINSWPTTATSVGVRNLKNEFQVYAPFGLQDLLGMVVRPNKILVTKDVYLEKTQRWAGHWPKLTVIDWDSGRPADD